MLETFKTYVIGLFIFFLIDMTWLAVVAKNLYRQELGFIMRAKPNWLAAISFYLIFISGLVFFVIQPSLEKDNWQYALVVGMFFGFVNYVTYDLTNLATLKDWPLRMTMIDLIWGSFLGGLVSVVTFTIVKAL